jgi:hypothetical protein
MFLDSSVLGRIYAYRRKVTLGDGIYVRYMDIFTNRAQVKPKLSACQVERRQAM